MGLLADYNQEFYRTAIREVDFRNEAHRIAEEINDYVREETNGKIDKFFDELSPSTLLVLLNAVYFKGEWKTRFETEETRDEFFYNNGVWNQKKGRQICS
ncbi:unnamed protein product [Larinioides sclopetarius]|uniref:Serpin domain-containing protein n=1 Tax=Larinioides sclopetarius TaxID=280406 RepID=A0AAV2BNS5_9ARAC